MTTQDENSVSFGDYLNSYLNDANIECFKRCVKDFSSENLNKSEKECSENCFEKYFISYSNIAELMDLRNLPKK